MEDLFKLNGIDIFEKSKHKNINLNKAKSSKKDEFFTQYKDIEKELIFYKKHFKNKLIYLPCDYYKKSQFYKYFKDNFKKFKLKGLMATFKSFTKKGKLAIYNLEGEKIFNLHNSGDFRYFNIYDLIEQSDLIITNPPFSLLQVFIELLMEARSKYIFLAPFNCVATLNFFTLFKDKKAFVGKHFRHHFYNPKNELIDMHTIWVNNLNKENLLEKKVEITYDELPEKNFHANKYGEPILKIDKLKLIPNDYFKKMYVPITFAMYKWNYDFEIIGYSQGVYNNEGKRSFFRLIIIRKGANNGEKNSNLIRFKI